MGYELPEGYGEWSHQTANAYFYDTYYNDRKSAYERYEIWLAWTAIMGVSQNLTTLYPDTPAEERLPEWTKVKSREDGLTYTIHDATATNNQFGYGVYRYRLKERLDTGFALYKKWFDVIADTPAPTDPNAVLEQNGIDPTGWTWHTPAPKEGNALD
jgi:hypothetical protein